jgi:hypothetical protein
MVGEQDDEMTTMTRMTDVMTTMMTETRAEDEKRGRGYFPCRNEDEKLLMRYIRLAASALWLGDVIARVFGLSM